jgi:hypothetical protein
MLDDYIGKGNPKPVYSYELIAWDVFVTLAINDAYSPYRNGKIRRTGL